MTKILTYPTRLSAWAMARARGSSTAVMATPTRLLGEWVRKRQVLTLEQAIRKLTFESASTFGIPDRGMLRPGLAADIVLLDPKTVDAGKESVVHDFPAADGASRKRRSAST